MQESKKMNISYSNSNDTDDSDKDDDDKDENDARPCYILVPCLSGSILYNQVSWNRPSADLSLSTSVLLHMGQIPQDGDFGQKVAFKKKK